MVIFISVMASVILTLLQISNMTKGTTEDLLSEDVLPSIFFRFTSYASHIIYFFQNSRLRRKKSFWNENYQFKKEGKK